MFPQIVLPQLTEWNSTTGYEKLPTQNLKL